MHSQSGIGEVLAWPNSEVKVRHGRYEPLPTTAKAFTRGFDIGLMLLDFEVRLTHLEWNALLCPGLFLLDFTEFRFGLRDFQSGDAEIQVPLRASTGAMALSFRRHTRRDS